MERQGATELVSFILLGVALTACAEGRSPEFGDPGSLASKPTAAYERALYDGYLTLADANQSIGQPADAAYFSERARAVAAGQDVDPKQIDGSRLPPEKTAELAAAWEELVNAQEIAIRRAYNPDRGALLSSSARAQVMFDCWMHKEAERRDAEAISACRSAFRWSLRKLRKVTAAAEGGPAKPATFLVYFDPESSELDALGQAVVAEAQAAARKIDNAQVSIVGKGDSSSSVLSDRILAEQRTSAVVKALAAGGLSEASIKQASLPANRLPAESGGLSGRVEIVVAGGSQPPEPSKPNQPPAKKPQAEPAEPAAPNKAKPVTSSSSPPPL